jgi:hypothetical protein
MAGALNPSESRAIGNARGGPCRMLHPVSCRLAPSCFWEREEMEAGKTSEAYL